MDESIASLCLSVEYRDAKELVGSRQFAKLDLINRVYIDLRLMLTNLASKLK